ncbi:MAG TPA: hypothetical protein QF417_07390 [Acidimicrobiales bacterium]|jgi:hypothetical protein|nr:hypothetical protein [Actinomycetes bacterium]MDP6104881.1 hypothetical protein [Acidimicrobiales bacterium]MDP6241556.1 hypothetical protein [Acidimicrobiales bacterium]MDP6492504.1 hypothetical protein [Acidimicrobiales bacterium]MDP6761175.1 hypothetical protein [Acidimicrobiales bacterium]|tara:strand:+ start:811 stop:1491 length:681 start_codon:yes stop_codon:yes gene_type:complete
MARGDSGRKVARAAQAGASGGTGERRALGFPLALALVVVLGVSLVAFARSGREATAAPRLGDHWHTAYDIYVCDTYRGKIVNENDPNGIHTHGDGLMHIHPFNSLASGKNATIGEFFRSFGGMIDDTSIRLDTGETITEGFDCGGEPTVLKVARFDAQDRFRAPQVITEGLDAVRYFKNLEAITVAFVPEGVEPPLPRAERFTFLETVDPRAISSGNSEAPTTTAG